MSVPRFDLGPHQMTPSSEGAYVRYEDYAKLEKALEQAVRCIAAPTMYPANRLPDTVVAHGDGSITILRGTRGPIVVEMPELAAYLREREDKR